ncbi:hypothetical protein F5141DRAFT_985141, partial [Pisolithus sp. B1]
MRDLGDIPFVSLEYFKSAALPSLPQQIHVTKIKESLQRDAAVWSKDSQRWAGFETDPRSSEESEDVTFRPLSHVFDAVVLEACKTSSTPAKLRFTSRPTESPTSERPNSTRPDAYLLLRAHTNKKFPDSWEDITVSFEFKKGTRGNSDSKDDDKKVIWSLHHIMRSDPCHRATFGVTIESTEMKFWFTCRAVTIVSKPFNF